jgi:cytoskeletal protein CcmA (bactofilin family)
MIVRNLILVTAMTAVLSGAAMAGCSLVYGGYASGGTFDGPTTCSNATVNSLKVNGPLTLSNSKISGATKVRGIATVSGSTISDDLWVDGPANLSHTTVNGSIAVNGPATFGNVKAMEGVKVNGPATFNYSTVAGNVRANGTFSSSHSDFKSDINVRAHSISIGNSKTQSITVRHDDNYKRQDLYLSGDTIVNGSITFVKNDGHVYLSDTAKVTGKITGATVENNESDSAKTTAKK